MTTVSSQHVKKPVGRRTAAIAGACLLAAAGAGALASWKEIRAQYLLATRFERLGVNAQGHREYRHVETGIVFVRLPGGTFWMGSTEEEARRVADELKRPTNPDLLPDWPDEVVREEMPRHAVTLSPFLIAKVEVSQGEWTRVMGTNRSYVVGSMHPIENVSWHDAKEFCRGAGLALPTEAQWEYACRAGMDGLFSGTGNIDDMGWTSRNAAGEEHRPVGGLQPNGFGLHDMHGNVREWVEDVHDPGFYSRPEAAERDPVATIAPPSVDGQPPRVMRGGGTQNLLFCRSASRVGTAPYLTGSDVGFRPVFNLR